MNSYIKKLIVLLCGYSSFLRKYYLEWRIIGRVPLGLILINFLIQRIFRVNAVVNFPVNFTSTVNMFERITLHRDKNTVGSFSLSGGCYFQAINGIEIGRNFLFAPGVKIISANHDFEDLSKPKHSEPIKIGNNVWIGANSTILPGVTIGSNCVIGAGTVVTKSFPEDNLIIAGNPAKVIGRRETRPNLNTLGG